MNKFVVFGNGTEWLRYSLNDFAALEYKLIQGTNIFQNNVLNKLMKCHFSLRANQRFNLPLKSIWYKSICKVISYELDDSPIFIFYDWNVLGYDYNFLKYLRIYFPNVKLIYIFTNISKVSGARKTNKIDSLSDHYDMVYAFDKSDSVKYGFREQPLLYSYNIANKLPQNSDVFYIGNAKDRLGMLHKVYKKIESYGLSQDYYIVGVSEEDKINSSIVYNSPISYGEVLKHIESSSCLIDIIQGESEGYTIKVCEAIFYNKLLITTNERIKDAPFYNSNFILVIKSENDIPKSFFENASRVNYSDQDRSYFSINRFIHILENDLNVGEIM